MRKGFVRSILLAALVLPAAFGGAAKAAPPDSPAGAPLVGNGQFCSAAGGSIVGVGASFANNAHNNVFIPQFLARCGTESVTYTAGGSGKGKTAFVNRTSYLTGSDDPLTLDETVCADADLGFGSGACAASPSQARADVMQTIPIAVGAVTVGYNLYACGIGTTEAIKLRSPEVSAIYTGLITKWNDPVLTVENPNLANCNLPIKLVARSDVSGTTFVFKDWLSKRGGPHWLAYKQPLKNLDWPASDAGLATVIRGSGNNGVAAAVNASSGAIGYVELSAAKANGMPFALVDGPHGQYVSADTGSTANCALAAAAAATPPSTFLPGWDAVSITDQPNPLNYSVCAFTYLLVHENLKLAFGTAYSAKSGRTLVDYLLSSLDQGTQNALANANYAPLPPDVRAMSLAGVALINDVVGV